MGVSEMNMVMYYDEVDKRKKVKKEVENFFDQYDNLVERYGYYDSENEENVIPTWQMMILMMDFAKAVKEY